MKRTLRVVGGLMGLVAVGVLLAAIALTFSARGQLQVAQQPYPPPQTPTMPAPSPPGTPSLEPYPPPATPVPTRTPLPTPTPGGPPTPVEPGPRPTEIVLTLVPPEVTDALTQPTRITTHPAPRYLLAVDGNYVVWRTHEDGQTHIMAYNLATGEEQRISSLPGGKSSLAVSGRYVVWAESIDLQNRYVSVVRVYDLVRREERQIGSDEYAQHHPNISGHIVVWNDWRSWHNDREVGIYGYDLQRGEEFPVVVGPGNHLFPRISSDWVIYLDWPPGASTGGRFPSQPTLRAHHLSSGEDIELGPVYFRNDASCCESHVISGHRVVWRGMDGQTYLYDLASRQRRTLSIPWAYSAMELHGNLLSTPGRVFNVDTGATLEFFRADIPYSVNDIATDGQTVAWSSGVGDEDHVYVARFRRLP